MSVNRVMRSRVERRRAWVAAVQGVCLASAALAWCTPRGSVRAEAAARKAPVPATAPEGSAVPHRVDRLPPLAVGLSILLGPGVEAFQHVFVGEAVAEHLRKQGLALVAPDDAAALNATQLACDGDDCHALTQSMLAANQGALLTIQLKQIKNGLFSEMKLFLPGVGWRVLDQVSGAESAVLSAIVKQTESLNLKAQMGCTVRLAGDYGRVDGGPAAKAIALRNASRTMMELHWYLPPATRTIRRPNGQSFSIACEPGHHYRLRPKR